MTGEGQDTTTIVEVWGGVFAWVCSRLLLILLLFLPFVLGCFVGGVGLHDPDTCWLLALGRYIFEHHALPATDPFSYSFALQAGKPFVMYQWLSELAFYCAYRLGGLSSLLMCTALVLGQSFLVFPLRVAARSAPLTMACWMMILGVCSACFHFLVRPEIASYFFMGICLVLMRRVYKAKSTDPVQWLTVAAFTLLLLVWANAHSAFVLGLILQITVLIVSGLQSLIEKRPFRGSWKTATLSVICSTLVTLCNPYGLGLWSYLPGLFFAKFNYRIAELRPIRLSDLNEFTYYPFVLLVLTCIVIIVRSITNAKRKNQAFCWSSAIAIVICVFYGVTCRRIIPFAVLIMIAQAAELFDDKPIALVEPIPGEPERLDRPAYSFAADFEKKFANIFNPLTFVWPITVVALSLAGCFFTFTRVVSPTMPQSSTAFIAPVKAIDFLREHRPIGNVLNDAQFGDMLIWYAPEIPVFIDTRYDMHGEQMAADYVSMMSGTHNWGDLYRRYKIDWLFLPPTAEILDQLKTDANWKVEFEDKSAIVLSRIKSTIQAR